MVTILVFQCVVRGRDKPGNKIFNSLTQHTNCYYLVYLLENVFACIYKFQLSGSCSSEYTTTYAGGENEAGTC
ncbi:hypothetical protein EB796_021022 [Bugula neritina]|uniref:Uncharacterized protein n=1 Tax=Bugula neritina TaxID=10212 RepID=A0A7J7J385_BUGNE|nr:hypothetical protein EB796_021022 [Bugula neritina]